MRRSLLTALASGLVACAPFHPKLGPRFYITKPAATYHDSTVDAAFVFFDEKTLFQVNALLLVGRMERVEQAACLHVAKRRDSSFWVDSMVAAYIVPKSATWEQITFGCDRAQLPIHYHVVTDSDEDECQPSFADTGPGWSIYPAELVSCGVGIDSVIAWRVKPVEKRK
jgi:hypothetical protein